MMGGGCVNAAGSGEGATALAGVVWADVKGAMMAAMAGVRSGNSAACFLFCA